MVVLVHNAVANLTIVRRQNAIALFQAYAEQALSSGLAPKGLEQSFAAEVQISPSMWSQIKSSRPIGDKLARQIERHCGKAAGWLDEERSSPGAGGEACPWDGASRVMSRAVMRRPVPCSIGTGAMLPSHQVSRPSMRWA